MLLKGKTALITGGSSGIGLTTAKLFKENGARLAITGTDAEKLERARAELGGDTVAIRANVASVA
ncbi:MAG: SDR family NAD(P)-dependent oxidoreductase, partial [Proteobacteria bacterium]|nr:SDR family NAD(P)-dependent oxidoreductase [Pseudomonadota bacterium]